MITIIGLGEDTVSYKKTQKLGAKKTEPAFLDFVGVWGKREGVKESQSEM